MIPYDDIDKANAKYGAERPEESQSLSLQLLQLLRQSRLIQT